MREVYTFQPVSLHMLFLGYASPFLSLIELSTSLHFHHPNIQETLLDTMSSELN